MSTLGAALVKWVNTFPLESKVRKLEDLCDGTIIFNLLYLLDPVHFDSKVSTDTGGGSIVKISNIQTLMDRLSDIFKENGEPLNLSHLSASAIAQGRDMNGLTKLLEYVLIAAVKYADKKETAVHNILGMSESEQTALMKVLKTDTQVEGEGEDEDEGGEEGEGETPGGLTKVDYDSEQSLKRITAAASKEQGYQERIRVLELEKADLSSKIEKVSREHKESKVQNEKLKQELEHVKATKKEEIEAAVAEARSQATKEVDSRKQKDALKNREAAEKAGRHQEELEKELSELKEKSETFKRKTAIEISDLKATNRKLQDDLDLASTKLKKLSELEQKAARYKKQLGELPDLQQQMAELTDSLRQLTEQKLELEETVKALEDQKIKAQGREKELKSQITDLNISVVEAKAAASTAQRKLEEKESELARFKFEQFESQKFGLVTPSSLRVLSTPGGASLGAQLASQQATPISGIRVSSLADDVADESLKEKILALEAENKKLKTQNSLVLELQDQIKLQEDISKENQEKLKEQALTIMTLKDRQKEVEAEKKAYQDDIIKLKEKNQQLGFEISSSKRKVSIEERGTEATEPKRKPQKVEGDVQKKSTDETSEDRLLATVQAFSRENAELQKKLKRIEEQKDIFMEEQRLMTSAWFELGFEYHSYTLNHRNLDKSGMMRHSHKSWINKERNKTYG